MLARLALALALACGACTSGTTRASRRAWDSAMARPTDAGTAGERGGPQTPRRSGAGGDAWQALTQFTLDASDTLADGSTTISLPRLAAQLCAETPEALAETPPPEAVRCAPKAPLMPLGHDLEVELGRASTIGLAARDLTGPESEQLVRQALRQLTGICDEPWAPAPRGADNAHEEFHTCETATGVVLVLGRSPINLGADRWQFSLAVLGPG